MNGRADRRCLAGTGDEDQRIGFAWSFGHQFLDVDLTDEKLARA